MEDIRYAQQDVVTFQHPTQSGVRVSDRNKAFSQPGGRVENQPSGLQPNPDSRSRLHRVEHNKMKPFVSDEGCRMEATEKHAGKHDWNAVLDRVSQAIESALEHVRVQESELEATDSEESESDHHPEWVQQMTDRSRLHEERLQFIAEQTAECESVLDEQNRSLELWRDRLRELHARLAETPGSTPDQRSGQHESDSDVSDP